MSRVVCMHANKDRVHAVLDGDLNLAVATALAVDMPKCLLCGGAAARTATLVIGGSSTTTGRAVGFGLCEDCVHSPWLERQCTAKVNALLAAGGS